MSEIEDYRERVAAARREVASLPRAGTGRQGPPDERTGERWDRGNVLGHVAEMLPFWTGQVRAVLDGGTAMGRDELGFVQRRQGIDSGHDVDEGELLRRIDEGLDGLLALLSELGDQDLDRTLTYRGHEGARDVDLRYPIEELLVGHVEAHLHQLRQLG
jgi:DinB superfamily